LAHADGKYTNPCSSRPEDDVVDLLFRDVDNVKLKRPDVDHSQFLGVYNAMLS
jgi:hypothetical protein